MIGALLGTAWGYDLLQSATGWQGRGVREVIETRVRPRPGERVLEIGCATAASRRFLGGVDYTGADLNPAYVAAARRRAPGATFIAGDATAPGFLPGGRYDVVLMFGLLHHLDDEAADRLLRALPGLLKPGGRLITSDNCRIPSQSLFERALLGLDRGKFIRSPGQYAALLRPHFANLDQHIRNDLLRFRYHLLIMEARVAEAAAAPASAQLAAGAGSALSDRPFPR